MKSLDSEQAKYLADAIKEVEKDFNNEEYVKRKYDNTCLFLEKIEEKINKGEYSIGKKSLNLILENGLEAINKRYSRSKDIIEKNYKILEEIEKKKKKDTSLYKALLVSYAKFCSASGYSAGENQTVFWKNIGLGNTNIPLTRLKLHGNVTTTK